MPGLFMVLIASVAAIAAPAQTRVSPSLVVGIVIDGLDVQYLEMLRPHFGAGGFNRLMRDGVMIANADYGTNVDATAATAMLMTGAAPWTTSVTGAVVYDPKTMLTVPAMHDPEAVGIATDRTYSPRSLNVSTLADEVRIAGAGVGRVYSVAPDPAQAILLAGHSANCAMWIDNHTGKWASSGYYRDVPPMLAYINRMEPLAIRLDTVQWTPLRDAQAYANLPEHLTHYPFRYIFARGNEARFEMFEASPMVNAEVTDIAGRLIGEVKLGESGSLDMLNLAYTVQPYDYTRSDDNRYELLDSYLRLDADIARLFNTVEQRVGEGNAVFFVAATPPRGRTRRDDEKWGIPYGEFSSKKAKSLLNMYLIAVYGNGEWVQSFHDGTFYLNHKLIEEHNLQPRDVREKAAAFLSMMSGVDHVYTLDEVVGGRGDARLEAMRRNSHPSSSGDLIVEVDPGWEVVDDIVTPAREDRVRYVKRIAAATAPVFILAPGVDSRLIDTPVDVRTVAPTVARLLRIRSPNGAALPAIIL